MATKTPVAELVQIPLAITFEEFMIEFNSNLLPTLLSQPGIISVRTGNFNAQLTKLPQLLTRQVKELVQVVQPQKSGQCR